MFRVVLVDDEPLAIQGLRQLLASHTDLSVVGEADCAQRASELIRREEPDAVFLDIRMPGASGFDLLRRLSKTPKVIFVTAHSEHAVQAFDVHGVDYLLKPVSPERFAVAISRLRSAFALEEGNHEYLRNDRICLHTPERTIVAALTDVAAIEAEGDFARVFVIGQPPLLICRSLRSYEEALPSPPFIRLDRSLMVNADRIASTEHLSRDEARLHLRGIDRTFALGRTAQSRLKEQLPQS